MVQPLDKMKKIIIFAVLCSLCTFNAVSSEDDARKIAGPDYIEINCLLSGGMKRVIFKNYVFTFTQTYQKKIVDFGPIYGDLRGFVEVQKKTRLYDEKQLQLLRDWIIKYKITSIKPLENPGKKDISAIRYPSNFLVYINSKEYKLNDYTIRKNPQLQNAFKELIEIAKGFMIIEKFN